MSCELTANSAECFNNLLQTDVVAVIVISCELKLNTLMLSYFQPGVGMANTCMLPLRHTRSHDFNANSAKCFSTYTSINMGMTIAC